MQTISSSTSSKQQLLKAHGEKKRKKEERINLALRDALFMHSDSQPRWEELIAKGAHDNQIWHSIAREFGGGGSSQTTGGDQYAFQGGKGVEPSKFWFACGTYLTDAKPTLAGARLVKRVRELLQIPQLASSEAALSSNDPASLGTTSGTGESGSQKRVMDLAFLADLEDEQKGRWATLCEYERLYEAATKIRDKRRLTKERMMIVADYERAWDEAVKALDNNSDIVQEVRDRVEAESSTIVESGDESGLIGWHEYFEQTPGEGCFLGCGKPEDDPIHHEPATAERAENGDAGSQATPVIETSPVTPLIFTKEIEVELADSDYKSKSRQLAFLRVQIEELLLEKKTTDEGYKQKIGGLEEQCTELFRSIRRGRDTLELEVFERRDYERKVVETVRADNHAVVDSRPMQARELQQPLPSI